MKPENHQLLHDLLEGDDASIRRLTVLNTGRRVLRRRRRVRLLTRASAAASLAAVLIFAVSQLVVPPPAPAFKASPRRAANPPAPPQAHVQCLTDDELLALFPGTPVGLVKVNGKQRLIFPRPGDEARFIVHL